MGFTDADALTLFRLNGSNTVLIFKLVINELIYYISCSFEIFPMKTRSRCSLQLIECTHSLVPTDMTA